MTRLDFYEGTWRMCMGVFLVGAVEEQPVRTLRAGQCRCLNISTGAFMMELLDSPSRLKKYVLFLSYLIQKVQMRVKLRYPSVDRNVNLGRGR